ncbi:MAG: hypothetical protein WC209_16385 [Ignavibacteriaceae bacterium]|jgi:hypothetical protein
MGDEFIPDYERYTIAELVDVFNRIDKINNPKRAKAIEEQLRAKLKIDPMMSFNDETVKQKLNGYLENYTVIKSEKPAYEKKIRRGWIAGVILGILSLLITIYSLNTPGNSALRESFNEWTFIDITICFGLSFGVYKKNKIAAILLLALFLIPRIIGFISTGNLKILSGGAIFVYFFVEALRGILDYESTTKQNNVDVITEQTL